MATINNEAIEAEARALLRKQIQDSAWYLGVSPKKRLELIEQDVDRFWYVKISEAAQRVLDAYAHGK